MVLIILVPIFFILIKCLHFFAHLLLVYDIKTQELLDYLVIPCSLLVSMFITESLYSHGFMSYITWNLCLTVLEVLSKQVP